MATRLATVDIIPVLDATREEQEAWDRECAARWAAELSADSLPSDDDVILAASWVGVILTHSDLHPSKDER